MSVEYVSELGLIVAKEKGIVYDIGKPAKAPAETIRQDYNSTDWINWSDSNNYAQEIFDRAVLNTIIGTTLQWKANTIAGTGVRPGYYVIDSTTGDEVFIRVSDNEEINDFMRKNNLQMYCEEILRDLYWWNMAYCDFGLRKDRKKIVSVISQEAFECRIGRQNKITGLKDFVFQSAMWPMMDEANISKIRAVDPYYDVHGQVANGKDSRYMYPLSFSIPGKKFYQDAPWHSIIFSKWIDIAEKIPKLKAKMMDNQMHIKYVVHIPLSWWKNKFPDWLTKPELQTQRMMETVTHFNSIMTGTENVGKTIMATFDDSTPGKDYAKWEIKELNSRITSNDYLEDSAEASLHTLFALDVDPTLKGNSPGKQMGAGSGSDKRVAMNIFILNNQSFQKKCTSPLDFISEYNEWTGPKGEPIVWEFQNKLLATEDTKSTQQRM